MIQFVANEHNTGQKRKQVARACEACRAKKKRCDHLPGAAPERRKRKTSHSDHAGTITAAPVRETPVPDQSESTDVGISNLPEPADPEDIFHAAMQQISSSGAQNNEKFWPERREHLQSSSDPHSAAGPRTKHIYRNMPTIVQAVLPYVQAESLSVVPSDFNRKALLEIYRKKIHPVLPILDLRSLVQPAEDTPALTMLTQAGCLVASKDPSANTYLQLPGSEEALLPPERFADRIFAALKIALDLSLVRDPIVLIQVYSLMAFHVCGADGYDEIARMSGQAVHFSYSVGLHSSNRRCRHDDEYLDTLLCCVWTLDKLVANLCGRPCLMHERDFGRDLSACRERQVPSFRLKIRLTNLLENVMQNYDKKTSDQQAIPSFEVLVTECEAGKLKPQLLGYLEIYYHTVRILAGGSTSPSLSPSTSPSKPHNNKANTTLSSQVHSASRISTIVGIEFPGQLAYVPMLPHALSLSLSVAHFSLRHSTTIESRTRAREAFKTNCDLLERLKAQFWLADAMAKLGRKTLKELDNSHGLMNGGHKKPSSGKREGKSSKREQTLNKGLGEQTANDDSNPVQSYEISPLRPGSAPGEMIINFNEDSTSGEISTVAPLLQQQMDYGHLTTPDYHLQEQNPLGFRSEIPQQTMFDQVYPYLNFEAMMDPWWSGNSDISSYQGTSFTNMDLG